MLNHVTNIIYVCVHAHTHVILWIYIYLEQSQNYANFVDIMLKNWMIFFYYNGGITGVELKNIGVVIRVKKNQINIFKVYVGWYASWYWFWTKPLKTQWYHNLLL